METEAFFTSSAKRIAEFATMQTLLFRRNPSLQDYFMPIQLDVFSERGRRGTGQQHPKPLIARAIRGADRVNRLRMRRKIKVDVLLCPIPYFGRKTENEFLRRTLAGLVETDARVLCLLPENAPCQPDLDRNLSDAGRTGQVEFLDPTAPAGRVDARLFGRSARMRADVAFAESQSALEPAGLGLSQSARIAFEHTARFVEAWERIAPDIEFDAVVTRCHWHALCSPVCRTAQERSKPAATFQQGVIGHTLDVPVTASRYVAFGPSSTSFLANMNREFFKSCGMPEPAVEFLPSGSLFDSLPVLPDQFDHRTLLLVDVPMAQADFYGTESQCAALLQLADRLLGSTSRLSRVIIRPHPFWSNLDFADCQKLVRKYPMRCELSHPAWSLEDDLRRASIVAGIFSGVLTVSSACGLPTIFLETPDGFSTGDLSCFSSHQILEPEAAYRAISHLLEDRSAYSHARNIAAQNARQYYHEGKEAEMSGKFFERLIGMESALQAAEGRRP